MRLSVASKRLCWRPTVPHNKPNGESALAATMEDVMDCTTPLFLNPNLDLPFYFLGLDDCSQGAGVS